MQMLEGVIESIIYGALGLALMFVGKFLIDLVVPYDFPKEIQERNSAAGFMIAGIFIAIAIIVRTAII